MKLLIENFKKFLSEEEEDLSGRDKFMMLVKNALASAPWYKFKVEKDQEGSPGDKVLKLLNDAYWMMGEVYPSLDIPKFYELTSRKSGLKLNDARNIATSISYLVPHVNKQRHEVIFSQLEGLIRGAAAKENPAEDFNIFPAKGRRMNLFNRQFSRKFANNPELLKIMKEVGLDPHDISEYFEMN